MRKKIVSISLALLVSFFLALPVSLQAAMPSNVLVSPIQAVLENISQPVVYEDGYDYVVFNPDGSGYLFYDDCGFVISWIDNGDSIYVQDHLGNSMDVTIDGEVLNGVYNGNTLQWTYTSSVPALYSLYPAGWSQSLPLVLDTSGVLSEAQADALLTKAQELSADYNCDVYTIIVDNMAYYSNAWDIESFAEETAAAYNLNDNGTGNFIMLIMDMNQRRYDLMAFGDFGNMAFTDYGKEQLAEAFLDDFKEDDWYAGFTDYMEKADDMMDMARKGTPLDVGTDPTLKMIGNIACVILGTLIALIVSLIMRASMKPVALKQEANSYVPAGGIQIFNRHDAYTHTTQSRTYSPKQSSSSSGGGTSISSSGSSHSSGSF